MSPREPLAIVGMACRFPGGVTDPHSFWELLRGGIDAITEVPPERWNAARYYHSSAEAPGRMTTRWGGFVANADAIDAVFFGISPREAARMDPQHRWLAEVTWEAIEDAGLPPERLAGTRTGVYLGISNTDYPLMRGGDLLSIDGYSNAGSALSIAANRLSFLLNLRGPSMAVDTACSSSLVALHLAAESLWSGECEFAIVGGTNSLLSPEPAIGFSHAHMLSPKGRCRTFDADADGYVRAEGAGAVLLMPRRMAESLQLQPRALVAATASNQDGRSSSLAVPNQSAQEEMIRDALRKANAQPRDVVYVETHGTGTPVGDPIESRALAAALGDGRAPGERLLLGAVKTNIGHLEPASGMAGLIKAVLVLEQQTVPPNLHFATPNPHLPVDRVEIPTCLTPLPGREERTALVAVNSFGFGGTNAHTLLAAAPATRLPEGVADRPSLLPISARSPAALTAYAQAFARLLGEDSPPSFSLHDFCAAAALGKSHHPLREGLVADSLDDLRTQLQALAGTPAKSSPPARRSKIAFVFSGQGPQWWAMGRQLFQEEKIIRDVWERCDAACRKLGGPKLLDALLAPEAKSALSHTDIAQPALFALQAGLVELWRAWGIEAGAVIGHSVGEAAAAWAAGIYDLEGIFRVIISRSRWQEKMHGFGRMLAASIPADEAEKWEQKFAGRISIAAFNAPEQVTLSGEAAALEEIAAVLKEQEIFCRFLATDYAFHSAQMDAVERGLRQELAGLAGDPAKSTMVSSVTGEPVRGTDLDADYWWRNVRLPVRFSAGIERLLREGCTAFLEIGPHPVMASALAEIALAQKSSTISTASLRRGEDERSTMLRGLAALYRCGASVRWESLYSHPRRPVRLPAYPWQRQRLWVEAASVARQLRSAPSHPLLGDRQPHPHPSWCNHLDARLIPWLAEHRIVGSTVLPAAAYLEMAAAAVREFLGESTIFLEDVRFYRMLFLPEEQPVPTWVQLDPVTSAFRIFAASPDAPTEWELHAEGIFRPGRLHAPPAADLEALRSALPKEGDPKELYREAGELGQIFGPTFQGLASLRHGADEAIGEIAKSDEAESSGYLLFPPQLDGCIHPLGALPIDRNSNAIIASARQVRIFQPLPSRVWSHARLVESGQNSHVADLAIHDPDGALLVQIDGLVLRTVETDGRRTRRAGVLYQLAWEAAPPLAVDETGAARDEVLVFCEPDGRGAGFADALQARGIPALKVVVEGQTEPTGDDSIAVNLQLDDWAIRLWQSIAARGPQPARAIYFWNGDPALPQDGCAPLLALIQGRLATPNPDRPARWMIVTRRAQAVHGTESVDPAAAALWGFARSVQTELPQFQVSLVDCADDSTDEELLGELVAAGIEPEVALRPDGRRVRRLREIQPPPPAAAAPPPPAFALEIGQAGRTDTLQFRGRARLAPGAREVEVEIAAAGLNFRDLMKTLGIYPLQDGEVATLGDEFSGRVARVARVARGVEEFVPGDRVMGFATSGGAFGSHLIVPAEALWKVPVHLSFAEAASIPVAFGTAYYALRSLARLRRGETILIHAAAGGVGLAAVQLALQLGAVVFATAGSEEKRDYLRALGVAHVMDSRTLDFADETLGRTGGRGVDVVLNSLAGAFQQKSLAVCAPHGRFVEIGKRDLFERHGLPLAAFQRSLSFFAFDLAAVLASGGAERIAMRRFLAQGFARGRVKPIRHTCFAADKATTAFRLMQNAQHIGKVVIEFDASRAPEVPAEFWPSAEGTYLISGGLSGFGLATARWLAARGARHLALLSRRGTPADADGAGIEEMRERGVSITTLAADVTDPDAVAAALQQISMMPPLRGVFHAAMVLRDSTLATMTRADLDAVLAPKVAGAWNLHLQTRDLPLDCFVLFSSVSSLVGSPGQANYAAANAFLDALAHHRRALGLPALSINWGQIADAGIVAARPELGRYLENIGVRAVPAQDALAALSRLLVSAEAQVGVMDLNWDKLSRANVKFGTSPVFHDLVKAGRASRVLDRGASEWRAAILRLSPEDQVAAVSELVMAQLAATLGMAASEIDLTRPLNQSGMDSLMAVELKARIENHTGVELPISLFNADMSAGRLAERFLRQLSKSASDTPPGGDTSPAVETGPPTADPEPAPEPLRTEPASDDAPANPEPTETSAESVAVPDITHWASATATARRTLPHPLLSTRVTTLRALFGEYGWPDGRLRYWLRALSLLSVCAARMPFRIVESWRIRHWIEPRPLVQPPVFVIGHWRSGTTHLHQLLGQDPQFAVPTILQASFPLDRLPILDKALLSALLPGERPMDAVTLAYDSPAEEEMAMACHGPLSFFHAFIFPEEGRRIYRESVHFDNVEPARIEAWWRNYVIFLKKVQSSKPTGRLLLKNPANTARVAALRARFPGAKFIHIHRHPEEVYASALFTHRKLQEAWALQDDNLERLRETVLANYADLMRAGFEQTRELAGNELIEVRMSDLEANPLGTLESIYRQLELPGFDNASNYFTAYLEKLGSYPKNRLSLNAGEKAVLRRELAHVFTRWGYR